MHIQFPDDDRASINPLLNRPRGLGLNRENVIVLLPPNIRAIALNVDLVLDRDGHSVEDTQRRSSLVALG